MVFGWGESDNAHQQVYGEQKHESHLSHELIGGAASFEAMKAFEDHQRKEGKTVKHGFAKEALAGFVGAEVDKLAETKGLDEADKIKAHHHAKESAHNMYDEHYGGQEEYSPEYGTHPSFQSRGW